MFIKEKEEKLKRLKRELFFFEMKNDKDSVDLEYIEHLSKKIKKLEEDIRIENIEIDF